MLLSLLLLAAQDPETAVEAERAFNRAAQTDGQWTAFRNYSTEDAVVFTPQPAFAHAALPEKDPPITVQWWPAESYVSCDGNMAVNTGPWVRPKATGYFTTVWVRQADGHFKWVYDGGDTLATPQALPERPKMRTASCGGKPDSLMYAIPEGAKAASGRSADGTLLWNWSVDAKGRRSFTARLWNGASFDVVVANEIAAPQ